MRRAASCCARRGRTMLAVPYPKKITSQMNVRKRSSRGKDMKMKMTRMILFCGSAMYIAVSAVAQDLTTAVAPASETPAKGELDEIVVTARRRTERLQD